MTKTKNRGPFAAACIPLLFACGWKDDAEVELDPVLPGAGTAVIDSELIAVHSISGGMDVRFGTISVQFDGVFTVEQLGIDSGDTSGCIALEDSDDDQAVTCRGVADTSDGQTDLLFGETCAGRDGQLLLKLRCAMPESDGDSLLAAPTVNAERTVIRNENGERMEVALTSYARIK